MNSVPASPDLPSPAIIAVPIHRATAGETGRFHWLELTDHVAAEAPLTLRVEGRAVAVVMRTPGHDRELAAGFLLTEGVIQSARDVFEISLCPSLAGAPEAACALPRPSIPGPSTDSGDSLDVLLTHPGSFDPDQLTRHVFTSSSCGICSKTSLTTAIPAHRVLTPGPVPLLPAAVLATLPEKLRAAQPVFASTGGLHACAWVRLESGDVSDEKEASTPAAGLPGAGSGGWRPDARESPATGGPEAVSFQWIFEDVGRHNALDKLLGHALLTHQLPLTRGVLLLSGRISFELVQKAHAAGIPLIAAVGAPSSLAIAYAHAAGITLCGFVRKDRLNVYTHPGRLG